jgi:hypothetical protein
LAGWLAQTGSPHRQT